MALKIPIYTQEGDRKGDMAASETGFGQQMNNGLVHKMLNRELANKRNPIAHTLTKGEVRGGGKKPWKQKHTGRARQGSTRNPHWRGGGVAFGPRNTRNFSVRVNRKERRLALFCALSERFREGHIAALEDFTTQQPKTKFFAAMMKKMPFEKKVLFVLPGKNEIFNKSSRNIPRIKSVLVNYVNISDVLSYNNIVFVKDALKKFEEIFTRLKK